MNHALIMAGGSGTRFWPESRHTKPKQLLSILGPDSMLRMTYDRLNSLPTIENVFVSTRADLADSVRATLPNINPDHIIIEPSKKDTAPSIGFAMLHIHEIDPEAVVGIFPADHLIVGDTEFEKVTSNAFKTAHETESVVTLGIDAPNPTNKFGYIEMGPEVSDNATTRLLKRFVEKPDIETATKFHETGNYVWNSGMFFWRADSFFRDVAAHLPELKSSLEKIRESKRSGSSFDTHWESIEPISIDYGIMDHLGEGYVIPATFEWNDVGSWDVIHEFADKDADGNTIEGDGIIVEGKRNFVKSPNHFTAVFGLDDVVVIHTEDATLVTSKEQSTSIKKVIDLIQKSKRDDVL